MLYQHTCNCSIRVTAVLEYIESALGGVVVKVSSSEYNSLQHHV